MQVPDTAAPTAPQIEPTYMAMAQAQQALQPQAGKSNIQLADAGGGGDVPPLEIETLLGQHAQGKLSSGQVRSAMPKGWSANLRGKYGPYSVYGPDGKEHLVQP